MRRYYRNYKLSRWSVSCPWPVTMFICVSSPCLPHQLESRAVMRHGINTEAWGVLQGLILQISRLVFWIPSHHHEAEYSVFCYGILYCLQWWATKYKSVFYFKIMNAFVSFIIVFTKTFFNVRKLLRNQIFIIVNII